MVPDEEERFVTQDELDGLLKAHLAHLEDRSRPKSSLRRLHIDRLKIPEGFDFSEADLSGTVFVHTLLRRCKFHASVLNNTDFSSTNVHNCEFQYCWNFRGVQFGELEQCEFRQCGFAEAVLKYLKFRSCKFDYVSFERATLDAIEFQNCVFAYCSFNKVENVGEIDFGNALLTCCNLAGVDMVQCHRFIFDETDIRGTRLPIRSKDPWSTLVRSYTGANMAFNALFLALFFTPLLLKGAALVAISRIEARLNANFAAVASKLAELGPSTSVPIKTDVCAYVECTTIPVWRVMLGLNESWWVMTVGIVLLAYNACRAFLTWRIAPLKEDQQATGLTPLYTQDATAAFWMTFTALVGRGWEVLALVRESLWNCYAPLWWCHRVISIIFYFAIALSVWRFIQFLQEQIIVPA